MHLERVRVEPGHDFRPPVAVVKHGALLQDPVSDDPDGCWRMYFSPPSRAISISEIVPGMWGATFRRWNRLVVAHALILRGDELIGTGTIREIAECRGVRKNTIRWDLTEAGHRRADNRKDQSRSMTVVRIDLTIARELPKTKPLQSGRLFVWFVESKQV